MRTWIAPLAVLAGACAWGIGVLWLRGLRAALADPSVRLLPEVAPFLLASVVAAIAGAWLLAARGPRAWRVPAGVLSLVPLPLGISIFASMTVPAVPMGPIVPMGHRLDVFTLPLAAHAGDEDVWAEHEPRVVVMTRDGRVSHRGEAGFLRLAAAAVAADGPELWLCADKETPWQQVEWVLAGLREAGLDRVYFEVKCAHAGAPHHARMSLPLVFADEDDQGADDPLQVDVAATREEEDLWNGVSVRRPTAFSYRFGDTTAPDLATLAARLSEAAAERRGRPLVGRVRAGRKVPLKVVLAAASALIDAGMERWVGIVPADVPAEVRASGTWKAPLPYPR